MDEVRHRGVAHTFCGFVHGCLVYSLGQMPSFEAELWVFVRAILYAQLFGWIFVWVENDSSNVVLLVVSCSINVPWSIWPAWCRYLKYLFLCSILFSIAF